MPVMAKKKPGGKNPWSGRVLRLREMWGGGKKLSQAETAKRLGVTRRSVIAWESGEQVPARPVQILIELFLAQGDVK